MRLELLVAMVPVPGRSQCAGEQKIKTILPGFQWNLCHLQPASYYTERCILSTSLLETSPTSLLSIPGQHRGCGLETWSRAEPVTRPLTQQNFLSSLLAPSGSFPAALCCPPLARGHHALSSLGLGWVGGCMPGTWRK